MTSKATVIAQQEVPIVMVLSNNPSKIEYSGVWAFKLGISQSILGFLAILFAVLSFIMNAMLSFIGTGVWCGILFIISGLFGIISSKSYKTSCYIITFMVLSIIATIFSLVLLILSLVGLIISYLMSGEYYDYHPYTEIRAGRILNIFLVIIALVEAVITIISSAICCRAICGCCRANTLQSQGPFYFYPNQDQCTATAQQVHLGFQLPATTSFGLPAVHTTQGLPNNQQPLLGTSVCFPQSNEYDNAPPPYSGLQE